METLASLWWLWLLLTVGMWGYAFLNQIGRMRRMLSGTFFDNEDSADTSSPFSSFYKGLCPMVIAGLFGSLSFLALVISAVYYLITGMFGTL